MIKMVIYVVMGVLNTDSIAYASENSSNNLGEM